MAEEGGGDEELPCVDHDPLNEGAVGKMIHWSVNNMPPRSRYDKLDMFGRKITHFAFV